MFFFFFDFYGRENELNELNNLYQKDGFKFIVIYGRRRVGKSSLIQKFIEDGNKSNISYMALEQTDKQNLDSFSKIVLNKYSTARNYISSFLSWEQVFEYIIEQAGKEKLVIFIDEYPYIADYNASISSILQKYIDGAFKSTNITLVLCGSSMSFMENQVLGHKSPLYGRRDMQFKIEPFDYLDSAKFFDNWNDEDKVFAYTVTGGIPQYLNKLKAYDNIADGIKNEFLKKNGSLFEEPRNLLMQELREPSVYNAIIRAIADGASKLNEIATKAGEESKKVSKYLTTLINLHLVKKESPVFNTQERNGIYTLSDNMFRFWYKFVVENNVNIESGMVDYVYEHKILPELPNYIGHIFEEICIQYTNRQNKNFKLPFIIDNIGRWWGNNPEKKCQEEIDIIAFSKKTAIFGECKWKDKVGIEVLDELKRKASLFKQFDKKYYYIFAKGLFSKALQDVASENETVKLITLKDIYKG
jgi:hypothetical protein